MWLSKIFSYFTKVIKDIQKHFVISYSYVRVSCFIYWYFKHLQGSVNSYYKGLDKTLGTFFKDKNVNNTNAVNLNGYINIEKKNLVFEFETYFIHVKMQQNKC